MTVTSWPIENSTSLSSCVATMCLLLASSVRPAPAVGPPVGEPVTESVTAGVVGFTWDAASAFDVSDGWEPAALDEVEEPLSNGASAEVDATEVASAGAVAESVAPAATFPESPLEVSEPVEESSDFPSVVVRASVVASAADGEDAESALIDEVAESIAETSPDAATADASVPADDVLSVDCEVAASAVAGVVPVSDVIAAGSAVVLVVPEAVTVEESFPASPWADAAMPSCVLVASVASDVACAALSVVWVDAGSEDGVPVAESVVPDESGCARSDAAESDSPVALTAAGGTSVVTGVESSTISKSASLLKSAAGASNTSPDAFARILDMTVP